MGATGALRVLDPPGGTLYLSQGRIVYAECPTACGADRLLTASGQVGADAWRAARTLARAGRSLAEVLLEQGLLAPVELESAVLCALHSAAYFLLHAEAAVHVEAVHFEVDVRHAFGSVVEVELRTACDEADRRRDALAEAWPDSTMDISAVLPVRRLPGHLVALTGLQWEVVANADRRRTPVDLARVLGRDTFAMLLEVRRMARAGLVEPGRPAPP
ncbi:MAG TPA: DUF4388 domain-containing protein, partial [Rugosimonospora sp.]|nr:DUF4388 domain-containing protein [Rugosimonospora sp.]